METSAPYDQLLALVWGYWSIGSLLVFPLKLVEIIEEWNFKKSAKKTTGVTKSYLSAVDYVPYGVYDEIKNDIGVFIKVQFEANGCIYELISKKVYQQDTVPREVEVWYNPEDPYDAMIDGLYFTGKKKYLWAGLSFLGVISDFAALLYYLLKP